MEKRWSTHRRGNNPHLSQPFGLAQDGGVYTVEVTDGSGLVTRTVAFVNVAYSRAQVIDWDADGKVLTDIPVGLTDATLVSAGNYHSLALKADGTVVAWGSNQNGQNAIPGDLREVVAVAAGGYHSLALRADGTVVAWGDNQFGQSSVPAGLSDVVAISAGSYHSVALKADGSVVAWGGSPGGEGIVPTQIGQVIKVKAGYLYTLALLGDGTVVGWGTADTSGQSPVPPTLANVVDLATGYSGSLALRADGSVVSWGRYQVLTPPNLSGVLALSAGFDGALALKADGTLVGWGYPDLGRLSGPVGLDSVVAVSVGRSHSLALRDASRDSPPVIVTGPVSQRARVGQRAELKVEAREGMLTYQWMKNGGAIAGATAPALTIPSLRPEDAGSYSVTVSNYLGTATSEPVSLTVLVPPVIRRAPPARTVLNVRQSLTLQVSAEGQTALRYQCIKNGRPVAGATTPAFTPTTAADWKDSGYYTVEITDDNSLTTRATAFVNIAWPRAQVVEWGTFSMDRTMPPTNLDGVIAVAAGGGHSLALKADGTVVAWGDNQFGQATVPAGLDDVVAVAAGANNSLALKSDGRVVLWGEDAGAQQSMAGGLREVVAIAAQGSEILALEANGTVVGWWRSFDTRVTFHYESSRRLDGVRSALIATGGPRHSFALRADGLIQDDAAITGPRKVPPGLDAVVSLAAGARHSMALTANGQVVAWGGDGVAQASVPANLGKATAIAAAEDYSFAVKADGMLVAWGNAKTGQTAIPPGLDHVLLVAAGENHVVALRDGALDVLPTITTQPASRTVLANQDASFGVDVTGGFVSYQWQKDGVPLAKPSKNTMTAARVQPGDAGNYTVVVTNGAGSVTSEVAVLTVPAPPVLNVTPSRRTVVNKGGKFDLHVQATGEAPLRYQWMRNGVKLIGATLPDYHDGAANWQSAGYYTAEVTDANGVTVRTFVGFVNVAYPNSRVIAWGTNGHGETTLPEGLENNVVALAADDQRSLALKVDGTVVAWGNNEGGESNVPANLTDAVAVAAGQWFSLALNADGTVVGWGDNSFGQLAFPAGLRDVVAIAAGGFSGVALKSDGSVVSWGYAGAAPESAKGAIAVVAGHYGLAALKSDGTVVNWGVNEPKVHSGGQNVAVAITANGTMAVEADGTVVALDQQGMSQAMPQGITGVVGLTTSQHQAFARMSDGSLAAWQPGVSMASGPGVTNPPKAYLPGKLDHVVAVAAGESHALALRDGSEDFPPNFVGKTKDIEVLEWDSVTLTAPEHPGFATYQWQKDGVAIKQATDAVFTIPGAQTADSGSFTVIATNGGGSATSAPFQLTVRPRPAIITAPPARQSLPAGQPLRLQVTAEGQSPLNYRWKLNGRLLSGATTDSYSVPAATVKDTGIYSVEITDAKGLSSLHLSLVRVIPPKTQVLVWTGREFDPNSPLTKLEKVTELTGGDGWMRALNQDGSALTWGETELSPRNGPRNESALASDVVAAVGGGGHVILLKSDGAAEWERLPNEDIPVLPHLRGVIAVEQSGRYTLALKADGTVTALRDGLRPMKLPDNVANVASLVVENQHALALRGDGKVLRIGFSFNVSAAVVSDLDNVVAVATNDRQSLAMIADGTFKIWSDDWGQAGVKFATPADLTNVMDVVLRKDRVVILRDSSQDTPPLISVQPVSQAMAAGHAVTMAVTASGGALQYQWQKDRVAIPGATGSVLTLPNPPATAAGEYGVVVQNSLGSVMSERATLTIRAPTAIESVPSRPVVSLGEPFSLQAKASGDPPFTYQWKRNGRRIPGATADNYGVAATAVQDIGSYVVEATDTRGIVTRAVAFVRLQSFSGLDASHNQVVDLNPGAFNRSPMPTDLRNVVALSANASPATGGWRILALKSDGTVAAWGGNDRSQSDVPAALGDVVAIATGPETSFALKADGTVTAWGGNLPNVLEVPPGLSDVVAVAVEWSFALALKANGTLVAWGQGTSYFKTPVTDFNDVIGISADSGNALALRADGSVVAFGPGGNGQEIVPTGLHDVVAVATDFGSLALRADGKVVAWGGDAAKTAAGLHDVVERIPGGFRAEDGTVMTGYSGGILSLPKTVLAVAGPYALRDGSQDTFPVIATPPKSQSVMPQQKVALSVQTGQGDNLVFQWLKDGNPLHNVEQSPFRGSQPAPPEGMTAEGAQAANLLLSNVQPADGGTYTVVVSNGAGRATASAALTVIPPPRIIVGLPSRTVLNRGASLSLGVRATGQAPLRYQWKRNGFDINGATTASLTRGGIKFQDGGYYSIEVRDGNGLTASAGGFVIVALAKPEVIAWGGNTNGQTNLPAGLTGVVAVAAGDRHSLALKADGTVVAWGGNDAGQTIVPPGLNDVVAIAAGGYHSLALKADGTIVSWGGTHGPSNPPQMITVQSSSGVRTIKGLQELSRGLAIAGGTMYQGASGYSLLLRTDGIVENISVAENYARGPQGPNLPLSLGDVVAIAAKGMHSLALRSDGTVAEWGVGRPASPAGPEGLRQVVAIAAGAGHALALRADGTVVAWSIGGAPSAVPDGLISVVGIAAGAGHSLAVSADGTVVAWGENGAGQTNVPTDLAGVVAVAAGTKHSLALREAAP